MLIEKTQIVLYIRSTIGETMIQSISHMTFAVKDLEKSAQFFINILGAKQVYVSDKKEFSVAAERFFLVGDIWVAIMLTGDEIKKTYNHIAFKIDDCDFEMYKQKLENYNIETLPPRPRIKGEGRSLYFYDYDNHLFELHTGTLNTRLAHYR